MKRLPLTLALSPLLAGCFIVPEDSTPAFGAELEITSLVTTGDEAEDGTQQCYGEGDPESQLSEYVHPALSASGDAS